MNIIVDLDYQIQDGSEVVFRSPVDCSQVTGLLVNYSGGSKEFMFADAHGNNVGDIDHLFVEDVVVKVILDVTTGMAFVQNADTNAYLEGRFASMPIEIADKLCPSFTDSGAVVVCEPLEGYPLEVVSGIVPVQEGSGDPSFDNVRPISEHTAVKLTQENGTGTREFTMNLGQAVYGGSLNWKTGVLTIGYANRRLDRKLGWETLGGSNTVIRPMGFDGDAIGIARKNTALCTHFVRGTQDGTVGQFWTSSVASTKYNVRFMIPQTIATTKDDWHAYLDANEVMLCYEMAEPITVQLTPQEILALSGVNTLYSDTGDTSVTGKADLATVVTKLQETIKTLLEG